MRCFIVPNILIIGTKVQKNVLTIQVLATNRMPRHKKSVPMSVGTPYCQKYSLWFLLLEEAFVQALEALSMTSLILCHFMNSVMDSIQIQCFGTCSDTLLVFASA